LEISHGGRYGYSNTKSRVPDGVNENHWNPDIDPFIQKLKVTRQPDGTAVVKMNSSQAHTIFGVQAQHARKKWRDNKIFKEIESMTQAYINLEDKQEDQIFRTVTIGRGNGDETAIENTLWLFNICINAYSDIQGLQSSVAGFKVGSGLETVVASGCYGDPPGLQMQQQSYQTMQQQGW